MEYTTVKNLVWTNPENTAFNCDVFFVAFNEEVPFCCNQSEIGIYAHVASIWGRATSGDFGEIAPFVAPVEIVIDPDQPQPVVNGAQGL
jgi:hypothetical protein